jgi:RHS repeat-associated protein
MSYYGKGKRTGMTDASGVSGYKYDNLGRQTQQQKTIDSTLYTTQYTYDAADRVVTITYPNNETLTQAYNERGLPDNLTGSSTGNLVTDTLYNFLGQMTDLNLGNSTKTTFGYYGTGGAYDTSGGYYGRLWEIKTSKQGAADLQDVQHTWDAGGNLTQRQNVYAGETENFIYDSLDRLTNDDGRVAAYSPGDADGNGLINAADATYVTQVYLGLNQPTAGCDANQDGSINMADVTKIQSIILSPAYSYNALGNITSKNGVNYTYGTKPHAVTNVGLKSYTYDANGNMTGGDNRTITWDVENRPVSITKAGVTTTFAYDGDGSRVKQTVGGVVTTYVNKYFEKTGADNTSNYYLGGKLIAVRKITVTPPTTTLSFILQDHLGSAAGTSNGITGTLDSSITYFSFGLTRSSTGTSPTDMKYTGQRLDATGLYYYGARYYDPSIGRFISADTIVPHFTNPQSLNRYSYCLNNPLKYVDPSGHGEGDYDLTNDYDHGPPPDYDDYIERYKAGVEVSYRRYREIQEMGEGIFAGAVNFVKGTCESIIFPDQVAEEFYDAVIKNGDATWESLKAEWNTTYGRAELITEGVLSIGSLLIGGKALGKVKIANKAESLIKPNPLEGATYHQRVLDKMNIGDYHSFPKELDALAVDGKITKGVDDWGRPEIQIKTRGTYDGKLGTFEWGVNYKNEIFHRFFRHD